MKPKNYGLEMWKYKRCILFHYEYASICNDVGCEYCMYFYDYNMVIFIEYGKYCSEHPASVREKNVTIKDKQGREIGFIEEGMTISGVECPHRKKTGDSWQSFCNEQERAEQGCK